MTILAWVKRRLRRWLLDEPGTELTGTELSRKLECLLRLGGKTEPATFLVSGVSGVRLIGERLGQSETRLIASHEAVDQRQFWALWKHFSGGRKLAWKDGTPVDL